MVIGQITASVGLIFSIVDRWLFCFGLYVPRWESYLIQYVHSSSVLVN